MHHAHLCFDVLGVCCHINHYRIVLRETSLEISFLPLELFVFAIWDAHSVVDVSCLRSSLLVPSREAKELEMHVFDEIELTVLGLVVDFLWVVIVLHREHAQVVGVCVVMAA